MSLPRLLGRLPNRASIAARARRRPLRGSFELRARPLGVFWPSAFSTSPVAMSRPPGAAGWGTVFASPAIEAAAFGSRLLADEAASGPEGQPASASVDKEDDPLGDVAHFLAIPWCRPHLRPPAADRALRPGDTTTRVRVIVPQTRRHGPQSPGSSTTLTPDGFRMSRPDTLDSALTNTLNTPDTIASYVVFYEEPFVVQADGRLRPSLAPVVELRALMTVGAGVNGHRGIMHGGICATVLDEILGLLVPLNQRRMRRLHREQCAQAQAQAQQEASFANDASTLPPQPQVGGDAPPGQTYEPAEEAAIGASNIAHGIVTGFLNITYVQPVRTSNTILLTARFLRREGQRKFFVEGDIRDSENQVRVRAEALFIALKEKL